jgi:hypothetical protein
MMFFSMRRSIKQGKVKQEITNPNGSDFTIVTDVLQYSVFATHVIVCNRMMLPLNN